MKNYIVIILGALCFVALTLFTFKGVGLDASHAKRFLYYYPNGLIANADLDNITKIINGSARFNARIVIIGAVLQLIAALLDP